MSTKKDIWFKAKTYGWGWTPSTWQGWAITISYVVVVTAFFSQIDSQSHSVSDTLYGTIPFVVVSTAILIAICYYKGEKPGWRWGNKNEHTKK